MLNRRQQYGKQGETIATHFLKRQGYTIIQRNYRAKTGEIDIIAKDGDVFVFVEVKSRLTDSYGSPKASITRNKQKKITRTAMYYMKEAQQSGAAARFDVVVLGGAGDYIELIQNAFDAVL